MSERVSTSLAAQLHSHAMASAESGAAGAAACHTSTVVKDSQAPPLQFEMDAPAAAISAHLNFKIVPADSLPGLNYQDMFASMNTSQISNASTESSCSPPTQVVVPPPKPSRHMSVQPLNSKSCRFPKLEECAHFHYERVQLGPLSVQLLDDKSEHLGSSIASQSIGGDLPHSSLRSFSPESCWFIIRVSPQRCEAFLIKRSFENMQLLDEMLHRCVYDRKISGLRNMEELAAELPSESDVEYAVAKYLERFSKIASDSLTCGTILTWLQLDNKGRRLPLADGETQRTINTPAVGAAYGVRRYQAQAPDEINIEVGDMISVIDMPSPAESIWWRGKKSHLQKSLYEVGFFPQSCVATIGDKVPRNFPMPAPLVGHLDASPTKPVLRKHGKLIAFFRSFILSRPSRRRLKQSGIYRERVFNCDLSEHLLNSGQDIPMVLRSCAEFIENYGVIDGIYRLSGITSNIQRLRRAFDEERVPDLGNPEMKQDIHAVSSLLKMYFRELPNPLCTYQLYDNFVEAIQVKADEADERLRLMKETVLKLPPPHYRTLKYLAEHLYKVSQHHERTGMTDKNLAIVWAPNLLRSPALESGGVAALRGVGVQAVVTEYLIRNCHNIFDPLEDHPARHSLVANTAAAAVGGGELRLESLTDCESLLVEQREQDQSLGVVVERPKSLSTGGAKLISLEEAQERHSRIDGGDLKQSLPISMLASGNAGNAATNIGSYIEVGGGPSSLPDKYHTVLSAPPSWQKRKPESSKTTSWKSLFTRGQRQGNPDPGQKTCDDSAKDSVTASRVSFVKAAHAHASKELTKHDKPKSIELLETTTNERDPKPMDLCIRSNSIDSLRTVGHSRSVSHDSYFDLLQSPQRGHMTTCPSRELSELGLNFDREEPEMRIFSESESLVSSPRVGKENVPPASGCATRRIMRARPEDFSSQTNSVNPSPKKQPRLNLLSPSSARTMPPPPPPAVGASASAAVSSCGHEPAGAENCCKRYKLEDQLCDIQFIDCGTPESVPTTQQQFASVEVHPPPKPARAAQSPTTPPSMVTSGCSSSSSTRYSYPTVQSAAKRKDQLAAKERFSYQGTFPQPGQKQEPQPSPRPMQTNSNTVPLRKPRVEPSLNDCAQTKLSVPTPTTPAHSPRYSLLLCDTESSENSSAVNTPQYDMDPLMVTSAMSGVSGVSSNMQQQQQLLLGVDAASSYLGSSHESLGQQFNNLQDVEHRDMHALKRELSLDLQPIQSRLPPQKNRAATLPLKEQLQAAAVSPNTSNFTDNTSQSVTPSEFGYQHLQRHPSMHSLLATDESSPVYEDFEQQTTVKLPVATSPIKSTISITYKSPEKEKKPLLLLETNFDENIVYEQVKLFRNSVTEVNQMLHERTSLKQIDEEEQPQDGGAFKAAEMTHQLLQLEQNHQQQHQHQLLPDVDDEEQSHLLYENIELRKPQTVYENLRGEEMKFNIQNIEKSSSDRIELDSLDSLPDNMEHEHELELTPCSKSPSFSVKELANKFESSPVEQLPSFDFSVRGGSMKKPNELSVPKAMPPAPVPLKKLNSNAQQKITRSLDENAFVREFGGKHLQDLSISGKLLPETPMSDTVNSRRKSFDFTRPKMLNPPKRLPGMSITEEICQKRGIEPEEITPTTENRISLIQLNNGPKEQQQQFLPPAGRKSVLTGVILDRERIDKIKEERRLQLTQKYYGDTLKSRSRTELNAEDGNCQPVTESLRIKSKSRGDMSALQNDMDMNLKPMTRVAGGGSENTLHQGNGQELGQQRMRRISDEKNQNCDTSSNGGVTATSMLSVKTTAKNFGSTAKQAPSNKFEQRGHPALPRERLQRNSMAESSPGGTNNRERISPQFSIRDVTAMFESRSQNQ
ncbi:GTPase-activating protein CdGAPr isoform X1 [Drosophila serrata]|uniref:GTPase-activating protein CdGAPr isoform X1 n=1 Tax=Drosophila serrata TaxID=7274 RepID=UPI000A1D2B25|nr:GTPase-activating protein CdGAPr isoform X1 [Drosophila serrata]XP_020804734.1 GTPase-activating protein CdGAPr isoform X1 [Drosophila serrata]XP_020804735.1 GTPase-activating protein CdGAPr isoform X1 [Drosophila serrata]